MKSVIAQGATVTKAVEEALKKASNPKEFFIKILQEAQGGFLGFGSTKAKVALFFKKEEQARTERSMVSRGEYKGLFNNKSMQKQIDNQEKIQASELKQQVKQPEKKEQPQKSRPMRHIKRRELDPTKSRVRPLKTAQKSSDDAKSDQKGRSEKQGEDRGPRKSRYSSSSNRRPRQGSRWGTNHDASKKRDDDKSNE